MVRAIVTAVRNAIYVYRRAAAAFKRDAITKSARTFTNSTIFTKNTGYRISKPLC
jgi:hypothetical protein